MMVIPKRFRLSRFCMIAGLPSLDVRYHPTFKTVDYLTRKNYNNNIPTRVWIDMSLKSRILDMARAAGWAGATNLLTAVTGFATLVFAARLGTQTVLIVASTYAVVLVYTAIAKSYLGATTPWIRRSIGKENLPKSLERVKTQCKKERNGDSGARPDHCHPDIVVFHDAWGGRRRTCSCNP